MRYYYFYIPKSYKSGILEVVFSVSIVSAIVIPILINPHNLYGNSLTTLDSNQFPIVNFNHYNTDKDNNSIEIEFIHDDLIAQVPEEDEGDEEENGEETNSEDDDEGWEDDDESLHTLKGFIEFENHINTNPDQEFGDAFKKNELRSHLDYRFGTSSIHLQLNLDLYLLPYIFSNTINNEYIYSDRFRVTRNGRITSEALEAVFQKFYFNVETGIFRFRLGNQLYEWGTTDVFNPTAYFNPFDLREFLIRDIDELKQGVPSFSSLITLGDYSLEAVIVPIHVPITIAEMNNFWSLQYKEGPFPVLVGDPEELAITLKNMAFGLQFYMNAFDIDIYFSLYHGPDKEPIMRPIRTVFAPNTPVSFMVSPEYNPMNMVGFAFTRAIDKFIINGEIAYSPDKVGVIDQEYSIDLILPFQIQKSHYISYSVGVNYLIPLTDWISWHDGDSVITIEWAQSIYFDRSLMKPFFTDILVVQFRDTFLNNRLKTSVTGIIDFSNSSYIIMPQVEYKFRFGISLGLSYSFIKSDLDSFLGYYDDNDLIIVRIRYEY